MHKVTRLLIAALAVSATIPLTACDTATPAPSTVSTTPVVAATPSPTPATSTVKTRFPLSVERSYFALLYADKLSNQLAGTAVDLGTLTPGSAAAIKVADLLKQLDGAASDAQLAHEALNSGSLLQKIALGQQLYTQVMSALGK